MAKYVDVRPVTVEKTEKTVPSMVQDCWKFRYPEFRVMMKSFCCIMKNGSSNTLEERGSR